MVSRNIKVIIFAALIPVILLDKKINCFLVVDEAYYHFGSQTAVPLIKKLDNVIVLRTFSKAFGVPSIRAGYTLSNKDNMRIISKARIARELSSVCIAGAANLFENYRLSKCLFESRFQNQKF